MMKKEQEKARKNARMSLRMGFLFLLTLVLTLLLYSLVLGAQSAKERTVYYESVRIKNGDTLWSIALEYKQPEEKTEQMIAKIMYCNQIKKTNIRAGENIIVPVQKAG